MSRNPTKSRGMGRILIVGLGLAVWGCLPYPKDSSGARAGSDSIPLHARAARGYVVQPGDSADSIARRHRTSVAELERLNPNVDTRDLRVGTLLRVPPGKAAVRRVETTGENSEER